MIVCLFFLALAVEIRIEKTWHEDLKDKTSTAYKELAFMVENEVKSINWNFKLIIIYFVFINFSTPLIIQNNYNYKL